MSAPQELGEDSYGLPPSWKLNESRIFAGGNALVGRVEDECGDVKDIRIQSRDDLARIPHLRVQQPCVG